MISCISPDIFVIIATATIASKVVRIVIILSSVIIITVVKTSWIKDTMSITISTIEISVISMVIPIGKITYTMITKLKC